MFHGGSSKSSGATDDPPGMSQSLNLGHGTIKPDCLLSSERDLPRRDMRQVHADQDGVYRRLTMSGDHFNPSMGKTHASSSDWSLSSCRDYDYHHLVATEHPVKLEQEFYHGKHKSKVEDQWQDALLVKKENGDPHTEKRLLEQEVKRLQRIVEDKQKELSDLHHHQQLERDIWNLNPVEGDPLYRQPKERPQEKERIPSHVATEERDHVHSALYRRTGDDDDKEKLQLIAENQELREKLNREIASNRNLSSYITTLRRSYAAVFRESPESSARHSLYEDDNPNVTSPHGS